MYDHEPSENDSSNRIQPTFFHTPATQLNNPPKKSSQDPAKNPYYQSPPPYSLHSPNQSEPSAPPLEPEVYPPGRSEAYPPVGPYSPVGPETYPPAGPYSPQGVYPPTNYNHPGYPNPPYSNYGAVPPYPNTSDASPSWPWMAPPANGEQPTEPSRKKKFGCLRLCKLFWYFVIGMVFFGAISELLSDSVSKPHCVDSINWESLPKQIEYSGSLRITVDGNLSSGRIIIKDSDQETPKGVIYLTGRVSARSVENVAYKLKQDAKETHLEFQISSLSLSCVNIDAVIYVPKGTRLIYIDLPHSTIQLPNGLMNADMLQLSSSYAPIVIDSDWRGRNLKLTTNNADIQIKSIQADGSVMLATKNSAITVTEKVEAGDTIDMVTTNAPIHLKYIKSNRTTLVTSNARIDIDHALIESYISAHTSNSRLSLHLRSQSNPEVLVKTSNGRALVSMPITFEGSFMIKTSSFNSVSFSDNLNWSNIKFANRGYVMGERFDPSQGPSVVPGSLRIETSNANVAEPIIQHEVQPLEQQEESIQVMKDIIPVTMPDPFELHEPDSNERYVTYLPHSGFHNQRIELENALLLASYLNRTLLLPSVYLTSPAFPWLRFDKMYERLLLQTKDGIEYCGQLRESEPQPPECLNYARWTRIPWTFFYDFAELSTEVRVIFRNDMSIEWIRDELLAGEEDVYYIKDNSPFDYRIYDLPESHTPLQRFVNRIELDALEAIESRVIHFGSVFGSYRVLAQSDEHRELLRWVRRNMIFKNPVLLDTASRVVKRLGGLKRFVGIHLRVGDGVFKVRAGIHIDDIYHQLVNEYTDLSVEEVARYDAKHEEDRKEDTAYEIKQLRETVLRDETQQPIQVHHPANVQTRLGPQDNHQLICQEGDGRNDDFAKTTIYIATDCPNPRQNPLLQKIFKTFPCVFVLSDFKDELRELSKVKVMEDNVRLEPYLIPMIDAIISSQGQAFYGINSSTFSTYIERQLHPAYTNEPIKLFDAPLP